MVSSSVSEVRIDRDALGGDGAHELVDLLLGADVEAAGRVVEDEHPRLGVQPLGQHHLLLVAAGEVEAEGMDAGGADVQALDPARRQPALLAGVDEAVAGEAAEVGERDVGGDRQEQHQALDPALARDVADAGVDRLGRGGEAHLAAADDERAAVVRREAGEGAGQLLAARADDAGDAEDLARVQPEARRPGRHWPRARPSASTQHLVARRASAAARGSTRPAGCGRPSSGAASPRRPRPPRARRRRRRPSSRRCGRRAPAPRRAGARRR